MAEERDVFLRARGRTLSAFREDDECQWKAPFYFIQGADPQFGLMKAWAIGDCDNGGDEWEEEIKLTEQAVQAINQLNPKPKFFVLCGDLIHGMPVQAYTTARVDTQIDSLAVDLADLVKTRQIDNTSPSSQSLYSTPDEKSKSTGEFFL
nr:serine/threonine-protein phosphatase CPPED1-like [Chrysemys picta bellii]